MSSCKNEPSQPTITQPLTIAPIFSDHMVLQRGDIAPIWGTATPDLYVEVQSGWGNKVGVQCDEKGNWKVELPTPMSTGPYDLIIKGAKDSIVIKDVLLGEVWLASGQSNMEMPLSGFPPAELIDNGEATIAAANYPSIRFFDVPRAIALKPASTHEGEWKITSPTTADQFSATAYFFARSLHKELGVPIGIIGSNWGGTPVESWISKKKIIELGEFEKELLALSEENVNKFTNWFAQFPTTTAPTSNEEWETLILGDDSFSQVDMDDASWETVNVPIEVEEWENVTYDGVFWFRKNITLQNVNSDFTFEIDGSIDDMDIVYINGKKIGFTNCWNCPRKYSIPKGYLQQGENTIAIRVIDTGGGGRIAGDVFLRGQSGNKLSLNGAWKGKHTAGFQGGKFFLYTDNPTAYNDPPAGIENFKMDANSPSVLFNGMINPLVPYTIKGAIWYQGESNVGRADQYLKLFPGMIEDWRSRWGNDFPFYFVQIAPFNYGNNKSPLLRDAQRKSLKTPKTGMAVTLDVGNPTNIHPGDKQTVGDRLAQLALANDYGKEVIASGPSFKNHRIEGNKIILEFENIGTGLVLKKDISEFEIAGSDNQYFPAVANLVGQSVGVSSSKVPQPKNVRYAFKDISTAALYNVEGFPASSFTTEE